MGHGHVAYTHVVHHAKDGQRAVNGMPTFHSDETSDFSLAESILDPCNDRHGFSRPELYKLGSADLVRM